MQRKSVKAILSAALMAVVGLSGLLKLADLPGFFGTVLSWNLVPSRAAGLIAVLVPVVEVSLAGMYFALPARSRMVVRLTVTMLVAWTGSYIFETLLWGPPRCGCFGRLSEWAGSRENAPWIIARNSVFALILGVGQLRWDRTATRHVSGSHRNGFTLIEALLVVALVGIVAVLVAPSLSGATRRGKSVRALADLRTHAQTVAAYAVDFRDSFPCIFDPRYTHTIVVMPESNERVQMAYFHQRFYWWIGLSDGYYNGRGMSQAFFSPRRYGSGRGEPYYYSFSGLARPEYWNNETRRPTGQIGPMKLGDVVFPERKGVFVCWETTGVAGRSRRKYVLPEVAFCSGSARVVKGEDLLAPVPFGEGPWGWPYSTEQGGDPVTHTLDGVRGVDVR